MIDFYGRSLIEIEAQIIYDLGAKNRILSLTKIKSNCGKIGKKTVEKIVENLWKHHGKIVAKMGKNCEKIVKK